MYIYIYIRIPSNDLRHLKVGDLRLPLLFGVTGFYNWIRFESL